MPDGPSKVIVDATALGALLGVAHRCIDLHAQVRMDTPEAKAQHARAVEAMRDSLTKAQDALNIQEATDADQ